MFRQIFFLIIGFIVLIKSSDIFVDAISSIAARFKMPKMLIALTVAAFGTCAPELAISFNSIISGNGDIALANVVGSNIINILLIIGMTSFCFPIKVKDKTVKNELPIVLLITSMFSLSMITHYIDSKSSFILTRIDGFLFLLFFGIFLTYIISVVKSKSKYVEKQEAKYSMKKSIILTVACIFGIVIASGVVVDNAKLLAESLKISNKVITMTIVVIGTSLPELIMTIISAKKKEFDIAIGNIIGTNIFNIGIVLGLPIFIFGGFSSPSFNLVDVLVVEVSACIFYFSCGNDRIVSRIEGFLMIAIFIVYYAYVIM